MLFFYARQLSAGTFTAILTGSTAEDSTQVRVLALSTFSTLLCYVPHYAANLTAGLGYPVPAYIHFSATYLLHFSFSLVFLIVYLSGRRCYCVNGLWEVCVESSSCCDSRKNRNSAAKDFSPSRQKLLQVRPSKSKDSRNGTGSYGCIHLNIQSADRTSSKEIENETML